MALISRLFRDDPALEACLLRDPAHVLLGAEGEHVRKIQMIHAATGLGEADHDQDESSVFSVGSNRSVLRVEHARALSRSFFATP